MKIFLLICVATLGGEGSVVAVPRQLENDVNITAHGRIAGGENAADASIPYIVSIKNRFGGNFCSGSIIAPEWILTAAHCLVYPKEQIVVITGTTKWTQPDAKYSVVDTKVHCNFNQPKSTNDIALLRLDRPIVYNERTQAIPMARTNNLRLGDTAILSGWGKVGKQREFARILQTVEVDYLDREKCSYAFQNPSWLHEGQICTNTKWGRGTCSGDSGGPLAYQNNLLVGVINWGKPCAMGKPDVYASVAYYYNWITETMKYGQAC